MAEHTNIAWATHTWSPFIGCSKVASGCTNCYAEADFAIRRKRVVWGPHGTRVKTSDAYWKKPLAWNKTSGRCKTCGGHGLRWTGLIDYDCDVCNASGEGERFRVFPSLCDPFEKTDLPILNSDGRELWMSEFERGRYVTLPDDLTTLTDTERQNIENETYRRASIRDLRRDMFKLIDATPNLTWILLTKRPENIRNMWPIVEEAPYIAEAGAMNDYQLNRRENVWLIFSASDQQSLEAGLPHLLRHRDLVPVLGLSLEPLLGPIDLSVDGLWNSDCRHCVDQLPDPETNVVECRRCDGTGKGNDTDISWVIVGGESGPNARPCALEWIDDIRRQCEAAKVPCFVKQMGSNPVTENANVWNFDRPGRRIGLGWGTSAAGCRINFDDSKGSDPTEWPEELRVQEFPNATR